MWALGGGGAVEVVVELAAAAVVAEADAGEDAASSACAAVAGSPSALDDAFEATVAVLGAAGSAGSPGKAAVEEAALFRCWPVLARLCCFCASEGEGERERFLVDSGSGILSVSCFLWARSEERWCLGLGS